MLSFIIPTLNEEKRVNMLLERLQPQLNEEDEVIIVDSHSNDRTVEIAESYGAKVVTEPKNGIGLAKTAGAKHAKNDILVFMDADCFPPDNYAEIIRKHFSDPKLAAVGGLDLYVSDSAVWKVLYNSYSTGIYYLTKFIHALTKKYWIPANNSAYRRDIFFSVGGYRSVVCEDTDMMRRLPPEKNVKYDKRMVLLLSDRRFKEVGFFRTIALWGGSNIASLLGKKISTDGYRKD